MDSYYFIQKIKTLYSLKRHKQVIVLCEKYLYLDNEYKFELYNYAINSYLCLNNHKKAEVLVKKALEIFPTLDTFCNLYARIYLQRLNYKKALLWIDKAISLDIDDKYNFYIKALILNDTGRYKEAKKIILDVLKEFPEDTDYLYLYAIILSNLDDKKYKKILNQILKLDPHHADSLHFLAQNKESMFLKGKGFLKALKLNPFDKDFQSSYKANKRDFWIFIFSLLLVLIQIYLAMVLRVDKEIIKAINVVLMVSLVHLSFYTFEAFLLTFLLIFINVDDNLYEALIGSIIISYPALIFSRILKSFLLTSIEYIKDNIYFIKNSSKEDIKDEIFSNIFYIVMFFIVLFCFMKTSKNLQIYQGYIMLLLPFVELIKRRVFSFSLIFLVLFTLVGLKFISMVSFEFFDEAKFAILGYLSAFIYALIAVMIIKRRNI